MFGEVIHSDNLNVLQKLDTDSIDLIYIDPPFNTNRTQILSNGYYKDSFDDFWGFLNLD